MAHHGDQRPLMNDNAQHADTTEHLPPLPSLGFTSGSHSLGFNTSPPTSPPLSRPGYSRLQSDGANVERNAPPTVVEEEEEEEEADVGNSGRGQSNNGLGIVSPASSTHGRRVSIQTVPRRAVGASGKSSPINSPNTASPFSPFGADDRLLSRYAKDSAENSPDLKRERFSPRDGPSDRDEFPRGVLKNGRGRSSTGLNGEFQESNKYQQDTDYQQFLRRADDTDDMKSPRTGAASVKSAYATPFHPHQECAAKHDFYQSRWSNVAIAIWIACIFSTIFSCVFLVLGTKGHRWGRRITSHGKVTPNRAIVITQVLAKFIELSFVTSFVSFLGQVLSRRAFMRHGGVTLSELSMWRWVVQPGTFLANWKTAKYALVSILGLCSLVSAILATLYSSAAAALVQPMLKDGKWEDLVLAGSVRTDFANIFYVKGECETPVRTDEVDGGNTCSQIGHAGQSFYNFEKFLRDWNIPASNGNGTTDQSKRPQGFGLLYDNTTVTAQWINIINTTEESTKYKRAINNVSMAMPHSGVLAAARDQRNDILQPEELNSEGTYSLRASVPSLVTNVLCASMDEQELQPIVYDLWNRNEEVDISNWPDISTSLAPNATINNSTVVDEIFGWTKQDNVTWTDYPPVFAKLPKPYNTLMNHTSPPWGRSSIYLLGQGGPVGGQTDLTDTFMICKIGFSITPHCSTMYNATGSGGTMEALCEGRDDMAYIKSDPDALDVKPVPNWPDIGFEWANSLSMNDGIMDANSSNARLITQFMLDPSQGEQVDLNPSLPSSAEALAVLTGSALLKSAVEAPFVAFWNYTNVYHSLLGAPKTQYFNASLKAQQYASGFENDKASAAWIIVLVLVFVGNIFIILYFLLHRGLVTDFCEPPNLFALAVNSPPSQCLAGSCGRGPEESQFSINWYVQNEGDHLFMEPGGQYHDHPHHHHANPADSKPYPHVSVHPHNGSDMPPQAVDMRPKKGFFAPVASRFARARDVVRDRFSTANRQDSRQHRYERQSQVDPHQVYCNSPPQPHDAPQEMQQMSPQSPQDQQQQPGEMHSPSQQDEAQSPQPRDQHQHQQQTPILSPDSQHNPPIMQSPQAQTSPSSPQSPPYHHRNTLSSPQSRFFTAPTSYQPHPHARFSSTAQSVRPHSVAYMGGGNGYEPEAEAADTPFQKRVMEFRKRRSLL